MGRLDRGARAAAVVLRAPCSASSHRRSLRTLPQSVRAGGIAYYNPAAATGATSDRRPRARRPAISTRVAAAVSRRGYTIVERAADPPALRRRAPDRTSARTRGRGAALRQARRRLRRAVVSDERQRRAGGPLYTQQSTLPRSRARARSLGHREGRAERHRRRPRHRHRHHPSDLQGRIWTNTDEIAGQRRRRRRQRLRRRRPRLRVRRRTDRPAAANRANGDIRDDLGHGTFVSGVIAANGEQPGMVGVARGVTVMPVKVLDCKGVGNTFALAQGILYAVQNGASRAERQPRRRRSIREYVREAIRIAHDEYGVLLVAATGNTGGDVALSGALSRGAGSRRRVGVASGPARVVLRRGTGGRRRRRRTGDRRHGAGRRLQRVPGVPARATRPTPSATARRSRRRRSRGSLRSCCRATAT